MPVFSVGQARRNQLEKASEIEAIVCLQMRWAAAKRRSGGKTQIGQNFRTVSIPVCGSRIFFVDNRLWLH